MTGNLFTTFVIKIEERYLSLLPFSVSLSLCNIVNQFSVSDSQVSLKWPNDVLLNSQKIAGILLEVIDIQQNPNESKNVILSVGIGLNTHTSPTEVPYSSTSLKENNIDVEHSIFFGKI